MLLRLRTRKTHLFMLHSRLCSTFNSGSTVVVSPNSNDPFPGGELFRKPATEQTSSSISELTEQSLVLTYQFEKKWNWLTVSLFSLWNRYNDDAQLLSDTIKSRQALLDETINDLSLLSAVPVPPLLPQQTQEIIMSEKLKNLDKLNWLKELKDMVVKQDEMSSELTNCRRTLLEEIVVNFSKIRHRRAPVDETWVNRWDELEKRLDKLRDERRSLRLMEISSNSNPTGLPHGLKLLCGKIKTFNRLVKLKKFYRKPRNPRLSRKDVDDIIKNFSETSKPPPLNLGWQKTWREFNKKWNELYERLMELKVEESDPTSMMMPVKILRERLQTINRFMTLKEMLNKEDELSAELTSSRVTSLNEIIQVFSEVPALHDDGMLKKWNELNRRLIWFRVMELEDSNFLCMRANSELLPLHQSWLKPP